MPEPAGYRRGHVKPIGIASGDDANTNYQPDISLDTLATYKCALRLSPPIYGVLADVWSWDDHKHMVCREDGHAIGSLGKKMHQKVDFG